MGKASLHSNFMGSSLLGSLPQGLSVDERTKILQSTPLSPTLNLLSSMPSVRNVGCGGWCLLRSLPRNSLWYESVGTANALLLRRTA